MRPLLDDKGQCTACHDGSCWLCRKMTDPSADGVAYRMLWGETPGPQAQKRCKHLGETTGERELCGTCAGRVKIKLYSCRLHGKCSLGKELEGTACCLTCKDYVQ